MRIARFFLAGLIGGIIAAPATADDTADCRQSPPEQRIAACTRLISAGKDKGVALASHYINRGLGYANKGENDLAIADYTTALKLNPQSSSAYHNRANALRNTGETDKAIADYTQAIRLDPKYAPTWTARGNTYNTKGEHDRAIADFGEAIKLDASYVSSYIGRGTAYRNKGEQARAITDYSEAIRLNPKSDSAYHNRGGVHNAMGNHDRAVADYSEAIRLDPDYAPSYLGRGNAWSGKGEHDRAIADYNDAIRLDPRYDRAYIRRGLVYVDKGEHELAIADYTEALRIDPRSDSAYHNRGAAHRAKGEHELAVKDFSEAIRLDPKYGPSYSGRANAYRSLGQYDLALADFEQALKINPNSDAAWHNRGLVHESRGDHDSAIRDYSEAIRLDPKYAPSHIGRGKAYEAKGMIAQALADYRKVLELPANTTGDRQRQENARERIARLSDPQAARPAAPVGQQGPRRVALVIGNSSYASAGQLANPRNDARAMAAAFRRLGFAEVMEHYDLDHSRMGRVIRDFGDLAIGAEWAVVFFAGHGIEMNGTNYILPVDAELKRDSHVRDEAYSLDRIQAKVDVASKFGLVILDACRNNPFLGSMTRSAGATRSTVAKGLANIEPEGNVLVAYAAKHGTVAEDGSGEHSPFTDALLGHIEEPGLEVNLLFRKVRDVVRAKTAKRQDPFVYGALGSELLFFKQ